MKRLPRVAFTNLYGPTETTIASSYYQVPACPEDGETPIPIGTACDGERLLVLDESLKEAGGGKSRIYTSVDVVSALGIGMIRRRPGRLFLRSLSGRDPSESTKRETLPASGAMGSSTYMAALTRRLRAVDIELNSGRSRQFYIPRTAFGRPRLSLSTVMPSKAPRSVVRSCPRTVLSWRRPRCARNYRKSCRNT